MAHGHDHDEEHEHGTLTFEGSDVDEVTLVAIRAAHPALADNLLLCRRFGSLADEDKRLLAEAQRAVEAFAAWAPGFYAKGDRCVTCGTPTAPLFRDRFAGGSALEYGASVDDLPVHIRRECLDGVAAKVGARRSPQVLDKLRREHTMERAQRPTARTVQFFRHDVLLQPPFALEDWANSVAEANAEKLDRAGVRDIERLLTWVHHRVFH